MRERALAAWEGGMATRQAMNALWAQVQAQPEVDWREHGHVWEREQGQRVSLSSLRAIEQNPAKRAAWWQ